VAVLPGFFGGDVNGRINLLGRGGSDYSAAIAAWALDAELLEIWTDVDGIYSADPRLVPHAAVLPEVSYEEAMELSFFGAKVLHPKTIQPAREKGIPVRVRNSFSPGHPGSLVHDGASPSPSGARGLVRLLRHAVRRLHQRVRRALHRRDIGAGQGVPHGLELLLDLRLHLRGHLVAQVLEALLRRVGETVRPVARFDLLASLLVLGLVRLRVLHGGA